MTRLYLHASVYGYTCMQAYPGGNTKRGKWVNVNKASGHHIPCMSSLFLQKCFLPVFGSKMRCVAKFGHFLKKIIKIWAMLTL